MLSQPSLFTLPVELRHTIYRLTLKDIRIILYKDRLTYTRTANGRKVLSKIDSWKVLEYVRDVDKNKAALLFTSKLYFDDAARILAETGIVEVRGGNGTSHHKILNLLDPAFVENISELHMSPYSFFRLNHALLPLLRRVHLMVETPNEISVHTAIRALSQRHFGESEARDWYDDYWKCLPGRRDGVQERKQLCQLAERHGWDMDFALHYGFLDKDAASAGLEIELSYDLSTDRLISKVLLLKGKWARTLAFKGDTVLEGDEFDCSRTIAYVLNGIGGALLERDREREVKRLADLKKLGIKPLGYWVGFGRFEDKEDYRNRKRYLYADGVEKAKYVSAKEYATETTQAANVQAHLKNAL